MKKLFKKKWFIVEEETAVSAFPYIYGWYGWVRVLRKYVAYTPKAGFFEFRKGALNVGIKIFEFTKTSKAVLNKFRNDRNFLKFVEQTVDATGRALISFCEKEIGKGNLHLLSNKKLYTLYQKFGEKQTELYGIGVVNSATDVTGELSRKIQEYLKRQKEVLQLEEGVAEAFSILTTPTKLSAMQKQDIAFYRTVLWIQSYPSLVRLLQRRSSEGISTHFKRFPQLEKKINYLVKAFGWLSYHYEGPIEWGAKYYFDLLATEIKRKVDAKKLVDQFIERARMLRKKQEALMKKFEVNDEYRYWIEVANSSVFYKGVRKEYLIRSHWLVEPLVREIARRLELSRNQVRFILPDEMKDVLLKNKFNRDTLNARYTYCVILVYSDRDVLFTGKRAQRISENDVEKPNVEGINELIGECACPGKARGVVKKINRIGHIVKMEDGDILVSSVTSPSLVPAMKKAAAIVTDMGGIASHAAIVSRELGIPCVTGTKIATKVFKDGDRVEVDAVKGIVRKIA